MTKFKKSFLKYFFFAGAIIFLLAYTFTTWLPKSSQMAKEEALDLINQELIGYVTQQEAQAEHDAL